MFAKPVPLGIVGSIVNLTPVRFRSGEVRAVHHTPQGMRVEIEPSVSVLQPTELNVIGCLDQTQDIGLNPEHHRVGVRLGIFDAVWVLGGEPEQGCLVEDELISDVAA